MNDGVLARVVEVEAVGERRVGEHGAGGAHARAPAQQGTLRRAAQPLGDAERGAPEVLSHRGEAVAEGVEGEERRLAGDGLGDRVEGEAGDEARQPAGRRHSRSSLAMTRRWIWLVPS